MMTTRLVTCDHRQVADTARENKTRAAYCQCHDQYHSGNTRAHLREVTVLVSALMQPALAQVSIETHEAVPLPAAVLECKQLSQQLAAANLGLWKQRLDEILQDIRCTLRPRPAEVL